MTSGTDQEANPALPGHLETFDCGVTLPCRGRCSAERPSTDGQLSADTPVMKHAAHLLLTTLVVLASALCHAQPTGVVGTNVAPTATAVEFRSAGVTLSGTLYTPSQMIAAAVLVHGSGPQSRNVSLAEALARNGVATLTYDKRGVGKSGGKYKGPEVGTNNADPQNLNLLAKDASAAVKELVRMISSPRTPVGLIGISQAGWIIPIAAVRTPQVKFMILWSGVLVSTLEQLRFQLLTDGQSDFWDHHTEAEVREHVRSDPDRYAFLPTDPVDSLRKLAIPGLWLYGDRDIYVPVILSIERLEALTAAGKPFTYQVFPDSGHELPWRQALSASIDWLQKSVGPSQRQGAVYQ